MVLTFGCQRDGRYRRTGFIVKKHRGPRREEAMVSTKARHAPRNVFSDIDAFGFRTATRVRHRS